MADAARRDDLDQLNEDPGSELFDRAARIAKESGKRADALPDARLPADSVVEDNMRVQCSANMRTGDRCPRRAELGSVVCKFHGGGIPVARNAARKRLLAAVGPAIDILSEAMLHADWPYAIKAAQIILTTAGFGPHATLTVNDGRRDEEIEKMSTLQLRRRAEMLVNILGDKAAEEELRLIAATGRDRDNNPAKINIDETGKPFATRVAPDARANIIDVEPVTPEEPGGQQ